MLLTRINDNALWAVLYQGNIRVTTEIMEKEKPLGQVSQRLRGLPY